MSNVTTIDCTRRIQFCAGHRVMGHENKCRHVHGHNYVVLVTAEMAPDLQPLDNVGRVIDFSVLKERVGGWIDRNWDHGFIYYQDDKPVKEMLTKFGLLEARMDNHEGIFHSKSFALPYNPTAENLARYLLEHVGPQVLDGTGVRLTAVRVWETENCYADAKISG